MSDRITTEAGDPLTTEGGDYLVTEGPVAAASRAIVGEGEPQAATRGEQLGVLGWVIGVGLLGGFGLGSTVAAPFPGGVAGAALGGVVTVATVRWDRGRERAFRLIRGQQG